MGGIGQGPWSGFTNTKLFRWIVGIVLFIFFALMCYSVVKNWN